MKLSMPIVVNGKTILDSGKSIENEGILEKVKLNGVKKIDVKGEYAEKLAKAHPDFYSNHNESISKAKESGRMRRVETADFLISLRNNHPKAPTITLLAGLDTATDIKKQLIRYFKIENTSAQISGVVEDFKKTELIVICTEDFASENIKQLKRELSKNAPKVKILAVYFSICPDFENTLCFLDNGSQLLKTCAYMAHGTQLSLDKEDYPLACSIKELNRPLVHIISESEFNNEVKSFSMSQNTIDSAFCTLETYSNIPRTALVVLRISNEKENLLEIINALRKNGLNLQKLIIIISKITQETVVAIKVLGKLKILLGDMNNPKFITYISSLK
jgi:hypothetical protein